VPGVAKRGLLDAVDLRDGRMVQRGERLRLALEAPEAVRVRGKELGQDLIAT
jgi:hypothetical protein